MGCGRCRGRGRIVRCGMCRVGGGRRGFHFEFLGGGRVWLFLCRRVVMIERTADWISSFEIPLLFVYLWC